MPAPHVEVSELADRWSEVLAAAASTGEVIVTDKNVPKARLVPIPSGGKSRRVPGLHPGALVPADDFDAPLPEDFWAGGDMKVQQS